MSGQLDDLSLVKLVQLFPILYDKDQARGKRNAKMKDKAWNSLSIQLKASERACMTRWKSIRDRFGKEYRRIQDNPDEPTYWKLFPHLMFLVEHYKHGNAVCDTIHSVTYKPKERKGKSVRSGGSQADDESNENDLDDLMLNQQLIGLVKEHPVLYDKKQIRDSKNLMAKNDAWLDISETLNISEEICYKRWKQLRDRFAREFRHYQLNPNKPVMWTYFHDLGFLESHYRKGIPLPINKYKRIKESASPLSAPVAEESYSQDNSTYNDSSQDCYDEEQYLPDDADTYVENTLESLEDFVLNEPKKENVENVQKFVITDTTDNTSFPCGTEEQLKTLISNMEDVLQKSRDCLSSLQEQKLRHQQELYSVPSSSETQILQKTKLLLDDLHENERQEAEDKILKFLYDCQIKSLNNEDIEDIDNEATTQLTAATSQNHKRNSISTIQDNGTHNTRVSLRLIGFKKK